MNKFEIQNKAYNFPYHYLVGLKEFSNYKSWVGALAYFNNLNFSIDKIKDIKFNSLLDIGCGDGRLLFELKKLFPERKMVGADLSEQAILFAKAFNYCNSSEFYYGNFAKISGKFDLITLIEVLEHIPDNEVATFVGSLENKLEDNGFLIVSVPSDNIKVISKHYRHYNISLLTDIFSNFEIVKCFYLNNNQILTIMNMLVKILKFKYAQKTIGEVAFRFVECKSNNCSNINLILKKRLL